MGTVKSPERRVGLPRGPTPGPSGSTETLGSSPCDDDEEESPLKLEDQLTNEKLIELQQIFEEADEDGGGGLDMDEFRTAMRKAMGEHLTDHELDIIFMKVDTNCDGTVDWDEYLSYMLLEYRGKDHMNFEAQPKPLPKYMKPIPSQHQRHHDSIIGISYFPNVVKASTSLYRNTEENTGRYISTTKEGVMNFWNMDMNHLKTYKITHNMKYQRKMGVWVTAFVCMPNLNMICVATTSSNLTFYDLTANMFTPVLTITSLEICVTCMDYWVDPKQLHHAKLIWGDARGNISGIVFENCKSVCFLQASVNKHFRSNVSFTELLRNTTCGIRAYRLPNVHEDFVLRVKFVPALNSFLSCCRGRNTSLFQGDLVQKKSVYFRVRKGVFAFDYCPQNNVLVTGGKDTVVRVWNPYVQSKPVMILQGHKSAIFYVMVNYSKEQIISISEDKEINVFDMSTQTCIQTIFRKWVPLGPRPISAVYFNQARQALLIAANQLAVFEHRDEEIKTPQITSHSKPVTVALYNKLFDQIVSGGMDSMVCVWDAVTGERVIQFVAHSKLGKGGEMMNVEITAMRFDPTFRRLITAARDGSVKVWNYNNGACLREMPVIDLKEITGIVIARQRIVTAGWNQKLTVYVDSVDDESVVHWRTTHTQDILCLALLSPGTVASASYDGDIVLWSLDNGNAFNIFNASHSTKPLSIVKKRTEIAKKNVVTNIPLETERTATTETVSGDTSCATDFVDSKRVMRKNNGRSVYAIIFLQKREISKHTANLVAAGAEGWIRFWSIHADGGLIGQFHAGHFHDDCITALTTDEHNEFLVTGDSGGYIKVWDISHYCTECPTKTHLLPDGTDKREHFIIPEGSMWMSRWRERHSTVSAPFEESNPDVTWHDPPLLNSFHGHLSGISHLDYIHPSDKILSCSTDCSVRVWSLYGEFVGYCGQSEPWSHDEEKNSKTKDSPGSYSLHRNRDKFLREKKRLQQKLPGDVRSVASATTMRVMCGGTRPHWKLAKNILTVWLPLLCHSRPTNTVETGGFVNTEAFSIKNKHSDGDLLRLPSLGNTSTTSEILGKHFKPNRKHQLMPKLEDYRQFNNLCDVYSSLPYYELDAVRGDMEPPQCLVEMRERQKFMKESSNRKSRALFKALAVPKMLSKLNKSSVDDMKAIESKVKVPKFRRRCSAFSLSAPH